MAAVVLNGFSLSARHILPRVRLSCRAEGGEEKSQLVSGDVSAVDLVQLDPGAQYEVQVFALVQNREGSPVSVRVLTREFSKLLWIELLVYLKAPHLQLKTFIQEEYGAKQGLILFETQIK